MQSMWENAHGTAEQASQLAEEGTGWEASNVLMFRLGVYTIPQRGRATGAVANIAPSTHQQGMSGSQVRH